MSDGQERRTREDADEGVNAIMKLMSEGQWVSGRSHLAIAERFDVAPATVKNWATSASRVLRQIVQADPEEYRARMVATLERVVDKAMSSRTATRTDADGNETVVELAGSTDLRAAVSAIAEQGKLLGLITEKHLVAGAIITEEQLVEFRSAVVALLCDDCKAKVLARVRKQDAPEQHDGGTTQ